MSVLQSTFGFMEGLGGPEMFFILVIVLILFGGQKLPEFARGAGKMVREFKKAASGVEDEFKRALEEDELKKTIAPVTDIFRAEPEPAAVVATETAPAPTPEPASDTPDSAATVPPSSPPKMLPPPASEPPV